MKEQMDSQTNRISAEGAQKKKKGLTIGLILLFALVLVTAVMLYNRYAERGVDSLPAQPQAEDKILAPDFSVTDATGKPVQLSDLRGKPVVVNFWASWCPPCKSEMPGFENVWTEQGDEVHFMMIDLVDGQRETREVGAAFIAESGYTFPVYYDEEQQAGMTYGIASIPTTLFIDKDGYIVTMAQGAIPEKSLLEGIELIRRA